MVFQLILTRKRGVAGAVQITAGISNLSISRSSDNKNSTATITFTNPNKDLIDTSSSEQKQFEEFIRFDDVIKIAVSRTDIDPNNIDNADVLFIGLVTSVAGGLSGSSSNITVGCVDLTDYLLARVTIANYDGTISTLDTASEIIEELVQKCNDNQAVDDMIKTPSPLPGRPTGGNIETTTTTITYHSSFRSVAELIKNLSVPQYTGGNRVATYYVDEERNFYWWIPQDGGNTTLTSNVTSTDLTIPVSDVTIFNQAGGVATLGKEVLRYDSISGSILIISSAKERGIAGTLASAHSSGDAVSNLMKLVVPYAGNLTSGFGKVLNFSFGINTDDVINMLIMRLGVNKKQQPLVWYKYNENTTTSKIRMKIIDRQDIGQSYYNDLIAQGGGNSEVQTSFTSSASTITLTTTAASFPSTGYMRITSGDGYEIIKYTSKAASGPNYDFSGLTRGSLNTAILENVEDETIVQDYSLIAAKTNEQIGTDIRELGEKYGRAFFSTNREKLNFKVTIEGAKIQPNEFIELTVKDLGINRVLARVKDVSHNIGRNSWTTELNMEEDDTSIN